MAGCFALAHPKGFRAEPSVSEVVCRVENPHRELCMLRVSEAGLVCGVLDKVLRNFWVHTKCVLNSIDWPHFVLLCRSAGCAKVLKKPLLY